MSNYTVGYSLLSNLNPKNPGFDVSANNLASSGIAIIGDNLKNLRDLSANLPSGNTNYFQVAVLGNFNNYGSSTDVSGISTGSYYTNNVSATRIAADSSANRPTIATSLAGFIRYNTDINNLEYYNASTLSWSQLSTFQTQRNQVTVGSSSGTGTITLLYTDSNGLNPSSTTPYYNGYTVYIFKNTGATGASPAVFTLTPIPSASQPFGSNIDYLLVGGGGGGGAHQSPANAIDKAGAGGGAGGYISNTLTPVLGTTYTISVGSGGAGATTSGSTFTSFYGTNGNNSSITTSPNAGNFNGIVAYGGGGGASGWPNGPFFGNIGGSGGGGVASGFQPGFGGSAYGGDVSNNTKGAQGYAGGTGIFSSTSTTFIAKNGSAGGGGAGGIGGNPSNLISNYTVNGGQGGLGLQNSIAGTASYYAAGGGGGGYDASGFSLGIGGAGGSGIGGSGGGSGTPAQVGTDASANTGSGGGGAGGGSKNLSSVTSSAGGSGSAGICVFRFSTSNLSYLPPPTLKTATVTGTAYRVYFTDQNGLNPSQIPYSNPIGYTVYIFLNSAAPGSGGSLSSQAYTFTPYFNDPSVNVLVVGGGGGSGFSDGGGDGGGGGGGVLALTNYNVVAYTSISLSVGCGGTVYTNASGVPGPTSSQTSATGAQSTFGPYTLLGGGFGGVYYAWDPAQSSTPGGSPSSGNNGAPGYSATGPVPCANGGGSSGRSSATTKTPGVAYPTVAPVPGVTGYINYYYGYSGGAGITGGWDGGGGGGGAAGAGQGGVNSAVGGNAFGGNGGLAYLSSISGYNIYYGGGGGGGTDISNNTGPSWTPANPGGYGGGTTAKGASGGNGSGVFNTNQVYGGQPGINGTGQGGGGGNGGGVDASSSFYGFGGGGTVIIRYRSF